MKLSFSKISPAEALEICTWEYQPPYDIYSQNNPPNPEDVEAILNPQYDYHAIRNEDDSLVAFCSFGEDARVKGGCYTEEALDIGIGVRPDLTGLGMGGQFTEAVLSFAIQRYSPKKLRVTIAGFNKRAQQVCINAGFTEADTFSNPSGRQFIVFTKVL